MPSPSVTSFVVRFTEMAAGHEPDVDLLRRIKVTHVQSGEETTVSSMEEATKYMEHVLERGRLA